MTAGRWIVSLALVAGGCGAPDLYGDLAWLRVDGAQYREGPVPNVTADGPAVTGLLDPQSAVRRGEVGHPLSGALAEGATAVALQLDGDRGYYTLAASVPDVTAPDQPTFAARFALSLETPIGPRGLRVHGAGSDGRHGPAVVDALVVGETAAPSGAVVLSLAWGAHADLDLRAITPSGTEIWARAPLDPETGGRLDQDSNAGCAIDGQGSEHITWAAPPPSGTYLVRVDCRSLCGAPAADFRVTARRAGALVAEAGGQCLESQARGSHDRGAGLTIFTVVVP